jgi:hypothetical protein
MLDLQYEFFTRSDVPEEKLSPKGVHSSLLKNKNGGANINTGDCGTKLTPGTNFIPGINFTLGSTSSLSLKVP